MFNIGQFGLDGVLEENNFDDYKKALKLTHTLWGGRFNSLIPVNNSKLAKYLVECIPSIIPFFSR